MKNLLLLLFIPFSITSSAQVTSVIPQEANTFYNHAMRTIKPVIKEIVQKNALLLRGRKINSDSLSKALHNEKLLKNASQHDAEAIAVLIMVQVSRNADADLKYLVVNMHKKGDSSDGISDNSSGEVETIMANKSLIAENVSLAMKKMPALPERILDNLR
ncbi:MAG: hypothetical protein ABI237_00725 [Ginsengibacter sp.]